MLNKNWENRQKSKMKMKINLDHQKGHQLDEAMNENEKEKPTLWMNFSCELRGERSFIVSFAADAAFEWGSNSRQTPKGVVSVR